MKKYYKLFIILLLVSFIIPQIVFASWWNPFSWGIWGKVAQIFQKTDTKTEILENRVKELENKLNNQSATATATITTETVKQSETTNKTIVPPKESTPKATTQTTTLNLSSYNSFIDSGIKAFEENITNFNKVITFLNASENHLQEGKTVISNLLASETEPYWINGWKLIITEGIDKPIAYYESVKSACQTNINNIQGAIATLRQEKEKNLIAEPVSVQEHFAYYDKLVKYINVEGYSKIVDEAHNTIPLYVDKTNSELSATMKLFADKETAWNQANMNSYRNIPSQVNNYYQYIPPTVQLTQPTKCYINSYGGGFSTVECY